MLCPSRRRSDPFVAIDFETADYEPDSACAVALVRVEGSRIVAREHRLIRPPRRDFVFTYLHGIDWEDVEDAPTFRQTWMELRDLLEGAAFLAAHNARFDRNVLATCCRAARIRPPDIPFLCTVALARRELGIYPANLPSVCRRLGIRLSHHQAVSDAEACARIVLAARC
ncbi:MAG: 3'-5' exonuclease [Planctomycetes bacterium]|nr:3'-5' exonuclease [Planctomycetota bacterium]